MNDDKHGAFFSWELFNKLNYELSGRRSTCLVCGSKINHDDNKQSSNNPLFNFIKEGYCSVRCKNLRAWE